MTRNQRQINIKKLDQAYNALVRAQEYVNLVGPMYVDHSITISTELATVSQLLDTARSYYDEYGFYALPIISQCLEIALDILKHTKALR